MVSVPRNYSAMRPPHTREAESPLPGCPALSRATPWETDSKASPGVGSSLSTAASSSGAPFGTENLESEMRSEYFENIYIGYKKLLSDDIYSSGFMDTEMLVQKSQHQYCSVLTYLHSTQGNVANAPK
ncbi:unnamed protein product [Rangifer tarandus platyrhynchus]|uniref:Uncharacterized protein n=2 Tax=Rangifer tarandus platyrhynchus TaxID=3082113 RepID=A0ABN8ZN99_RANTA|nr:unnamed protein product [Rangifer tarandus platyrhynchus]CAI9709897.1 unnamed protein product [Rangifer tarandus platyrhynchus]